MGNSKAGMPENGSSVVIDFDTLDDRVPKARAVMAAMYLCIGNPDSQLTDSTMESLVWCVQGLLDDTQQAIDQAHILPGKMESSQEVQS